MDLIDEAAQRKPRSGGSTADRRFEDFELRLSPPDGQSRILSDGFTPRSGCDMALRWGAVRLQRRDNGTSARSATEVVVRGERPEWLDLGYALFMVAAKVNPGTEMMALAIGALAGAGKHRADALQSISSGIDRVLQEPLKAAKTYLSKAATASSLDEQDRYLRKAQDRLVTALHYADNGYRLALAEASLGLVEVLLGNPEAEDHLVRAQVELESEIAASLEQTNRIAVLKGWRVAWLALMLYYPIYWIPSKLRRVWKAERAVPTLERQVALLSEINAILTPGADARKHLELRTQTAHYHLSSSVAP